MVWSDAAAQDGARGSGLHGARLGCRAAAPGGCDGRGDAAGVGGAADGGRGGVGAWWRGWRAQQTARGLKDDDTIGPRERLIRRFLAFTNEYPWAWSPGHMDEWSLQLTAEQHLAP